MTIQLYQHQTEGVNFFLEHKKVCLFYEVGTGKTFIALDSLCKLPSGDVLIVAPKRVLENVWKKDNNYDLSKHNVTYMNYEKIARDKEFTRKRWDYIILDEVHKLKGKSTKTSRKFTVVCKKATHVLGLTGTPVANSYADVYNIYKHCDISEFYMDYDSFVFRYYYTKTMDSSCGFKFQILLSPKPSMLPELMDKIGKHSLVRRARDCIELPDRRTEIIKVKGMVGERYKELSKGIFRTPSYSKTMIKLEAINKMHQAANGFVYDDFGDAIEICKNNKLKELENILDDMLEETEKVIIVYQYKKDLENLQTLEYDWTTDPSEFPNKQILFLQFGQSEGLNLQYCNQMIFYSYDYSFLNYEQITGRIYRKGQVNPVVYTVLVSEGTIEEKIWWAIENKKSRDEFLKECIGGVDG